MGRNRVYVERRKEMSTTIRPELSDKNKYWIEKHRYYELKHFCLQYPMWKKTLSSLSSLGSKPTNVPISSSYGKNIDPVADYVESSSFYSDRIEMLENVAEKTDPDLAKYILKAVTEGLSYDHLKSRLEIPCSKDTYYDRYRRFFWLLNKARN